MLFTSREGWVGGGEGVVEGMGRRIFLFILWLISSWSLSDQYNHILSTMLNRYVLVIHYQCHIRGGGGGGGSVGGGGGGIPIIMTL